MTSSAKSISTHQLFALTVVFSLGTTIMAITSGITAHAKQDAWIVTIAAPILGIIFVWLYYYLGTLYPGKTLVDMMMCAFGKWVGWILSFLFVVFVCFLDVSEDIFYVGNFVNVEYMTETPKYALYILLTISMSIALLYGLEAIARSTEIFVYVVITLVLASLLLNIPNIKTENLFPILENGLFPIFKGSLNLLSYSCWPLIIMTMIYPIHADSSCNTKRSLISAYLTASVINLLLTVMAILVLGTAITEKALYPIYMLAQEIRIGIINRVEGLISGAWIITQFIRAILYFYAGLVGMSQLFGLKDNKKIILPLCFLCMLFAGIVYHNEAYQLMWDSTIWIPFLGTFGVILPLLLILIALIKKATHKVKLFADSLPETGSH